LHSSPAIAQTANNSILNIGVCGSSNNSFNVSLQQAPPSGVVYIRLSNMMETSAPTSVYYQSYGDLACHLVGTVSPQYGQWIKLGQLNANNSEGSFVVQGSGLGALSYASVVQLLIVPPGTACIPTQNCNIQYNGFSGVLQPQLITHASSSISVYVANPVASVGYNNVNYYANGQFLYGGTALKPIDRNYLSGGISNVVIQANFTNGETMNINQTINMGSDPTGTLAIKSFIWRSRDKTLLFTSIGGVIMMLYLLLFLARLLYKRRRRKFEHGLNNYVDPDKAPEDDEHTVHLS
jgi:hypothetical protein